MTITRTRIGGQAKQRKRRVKLRIRSRYIPHVIPFAVCLLFFDKTGAVFIEELMTSDTFEAGSMPFHVRGDL